MATVTDLISIYGDVIELAFPEWKLENPDALINHPAWKPYNPSKVGYNRYGLPVTSLDGSFSEASLTSIKEYNEKNDVNLGEGSFNIRTSIVNKFPVLEQILDTFDPDCGRSHFLRLDMGGFFPPHRDGTAVPPNFFRVVVPLYNYHKNSVKWILDDKLIDLKCGSAYFINTGKEHSVFSFQDNCIFLVMNIRNTDRSLQKVLKNAKVS